MAIFGIGKKNKEVKVVSETAVKTRAKAKPKAEKAQEKKIISAGLPQSVNSGGFDLEILLAPRVTEKVTMLSGLNNVFTFNVGRSATKKSVAETVKHVYKVEPIKVRILNIPAKQVFVRGKWGKKAGGRKAYIYLKKGEKIETA